MLSYKYLAVRKPAELKGVYSGEENIKKMHKQLGAFKSQSSKVFGEGEEAEAIKWAGVSGLANVEQIAVTKLNSNVDVNSIVEVEEPELKIVLDQYAKEGYSVAKISLSCGEDLYIQIRDVFYLKSDSWYGLTNDAGYDQNSNDLFYTSEFNRNTGELDKFYYKPYFENHKHEVNKFEKTEITYLKSGVKFYGYNMYIDKHEIGYEEGHIYIPYNSISSVKPQRNWVKLSTKITDEEIIKDCEKLFR